MANKQIDRRGIVLVEGLDYLYLLRNSPAVQDRSFQVNARLFDFKVAGLTLSQFLNAMVGATDFRTVERLGIICDAEANRDGMEMSVRDILRANGFAVPNRPGELVAGSPATGYLIIPHDRPSGCLEHACLAACRRPALAACAQEFLRCAAQAPQTHNENWAAKVQVHSIVAGSDKPAMTLGESAAAGLWDFAHPSLSVMQRFLELFW